MKLKCLTLVLLFWSTAIEAAPHNFPEAITEADYKLILPIRAQLGRFLYFDPILSGNKNIACATCHHPKFATSDGVSLGIGEGGKGLGPDRRFIPGDNAPEQRIGRHSPSLFNLGAKEFRTLFHDGRLEIEGSRLSGFRTPLEEDMVKNFEGVLSAQAMFPVLSGDEMAGHYSENDIAKTVRIGILTGPNGAWQKIADRVMSIPEYQQLFRQAYDIPAPSHPVTFADIANAIADFVASEFKSDNSLWDRHLRGEAEISKEALKGAKLFYGKANCVSCHSGKFQTDHKFHAIAMPQFGPGRNARFEGHQRDIGRQRVTGEIEDAYKFRTPSLRNIAISAPYGHTGAYPTLEGIIQHHLDPVVSFMNYDPKLANLLEFDTNGQIDFQIMNIVADKTDIIQANELETISLKSIEITQLIEFLKSLTDLTFRTERLGIPWSVPSGLPVNQ